MNSSFISQVHVIWGEVPPYVEHCLAHGWKVASRSERRVGHEIAHVVVLIYLPD